MSGSGCGSGLVTIKRASKAVKTPLTAIKNAFRMQQMAKRAGLGVRGGGGKHQIE